MIRRLEQVLGAALPHQAALTFRLSLAGLPYTDPGEGAQHCWKPTPTWTDMCTGSVRLRGVPFLHSPPRPLVGPAYRDTPVCSGDGPREETHVPLHLTVLRPGPTPAAAPSPWKSSGRAASCSGPRL